MNRRELLAAGSGAAALLTIRAQTADAASLLVANEWATVRDAYGLAPDVVYLNHASIGTIPTFLTDAHAEYLRVCEQNPWLYMWGGAWEEGREAARRESARLLGCHPGDLAITHNTTEGINVLAQGLPIGPGDEVLYSTLNHPGASVCWEQQAPRRGFAARQFDFPILDAPDLRGEDIVTIYSEQIRSETRVVVFPHIDNIVGFRYPLAAMAAAARAAGVEFVVVDGAQSAGMIDCDLEATGVDFYATSGHKWLQGPKGTGLLYARATAREHVEPMWTTWGQQRWAGTVRAFEDYGTRNLAETLVLGDAVAYQRDLGPERAQVRLRELRRYARSAVDATAGLEWRSPRAWEDGSALFGVRIPGDAGAVAERLRDEHGIVLRPFGGELNAVRLSPNVINTEAEIDVFVAAAS